MHKHLCKSFFVSTLLFACVRYVYKAPKKEQISNKRVVFITGCDSGLGFSLAQHACAMGFTVFAGCLSLQSEGAKELSRICEDIKLLELNITLKENTESVLKYIEKYLEQHTDHGKYTHLFKQIF